MLNRIAIITLLSSSITYGLNNPEAFGWQKQYERSPKPVSYANRPTDIQHQGVEQPINFKAEVSGHNWVILSWNAPNNSRNISGYQIYRNNVLISEVEHNIQSFKDRFLQDNTRYQYSIQAVSKHGWRSNSTQLLTSTQKNLAPTVYNQPSLIHVNYRSKMGSTIHTVKAMDANEDSLYYTISGKDAHKFMINQRTGRIINSEHLTDSNEYQVTIKISDGMETTSTQLIIKT